MMERNIAQDTGVEADIKTQIVITQIITQIQKKDRRKGEELVITQKTTQM